MNMKQQAIEIYVSHLDCTSKIKRLNDIILDCYNEMEAQDQNMRPELSNNTAEAYRVAKNYIRSLEKYYPRSMRDN